MPIFKNLTYRENYETAMRYLRVDETKHAPKFDMSSAPPELQELMSIVNSPLGEERYQKMTEYVNKSWSVPDGEAEVLLAEESLNVLRYVNRHLRRANEKLKDDGYIVVFFNTAAKQRVEIYSKYPRIIADIVYFFHFVWHRMCPKMGLTRKFYYFCNRKIKKEFPRPEVLGRLYYCGFDVVSERYVYDLYCVIAQKKRTPCTEPHSYGPIIKLNRVGKDGKMFWVYKLRTMHAYSEFLQTYVYQNNDLQEGGKFYDDYRVAEWGKVLRKLWIDEWPMVINLLKGQMKLVGVRPLSKQYFSLYSPEIQQLRIKTKPGMLPPFYADMPSTLEEIQESERSYCEAYLKHPLRTDWKYFWKIVNNIVFKRKRSK